MAENEEYQLTSTSKTEITTGKLFSTFLTNKILRFYQLLLHLVLQILSGILMQGLY